MPLSGHRITVQRRGSSPGSEEEEAGGSRTAPFQTGEGGSRAVPSPVLESCTGDPLPRSEGWEDGRESWGRKAMHVAPSGQQEGSQGLGHSAGRRHGQPVGGRGLHQLPAEMDLSERQPGNQGGGSSPTQQWEVHLHPSLHPPGNISPTSLFTPHNMTFFLRAICGLSGSPKLC